MSRTRSPRPIVPSNQLRNLALLGGLMVVVPITIPERLRVPARKRVRNRRSHGRERRTAE